SCGGRAGLAASLIAVSGVGLSGSAVMRTRVREIGVSRCRIAGRATRILSACVGGGLLVRINMAAVLQFVLAIGHDSFVRSNAARDLRKVSFGSCDGHVPRLNR